MPRVIPPARPADERVEFLLEPGQVCDMVPQLKEPGFTRRSETIPRYGGALWGVNDHDATFAIVSLAITSPDVAVEAALDHYPARISMGPWMAPPGQSAVFLYVPARMWFALVARNRSRTTQHVVIYLRTHLTEVR